MNSIEKSNAKAIEICDNKKYRYLYGAKGQDYTSALVRQLAKSFPSIYSSSILKLALADADKGYKGIDCSGFVCKVLGISMQGSSALYSGAVKKYAVNKKNAKPGMAIWRQGHIAYVGKDLKIYEASSTANDMRISSFDSRAGRFTKLLVIEGSALAKELEDNKSSSKSTSNVKKPSVVSGQIKTSSFSKGDAVYVKGTIYANADGTGNKIAKKNTLMYIVGISKNSKHPYGVSLKKGGTRQGWASASIMKKK